MSSVGLRDDCLLRTALINAFVGQHSALVPIPILVGECRDQELCGVVLKSLSLPVRRCLSQKLDHVLNDTSYPFGHPGPTSAIDLTFSGLLICFIAKDQNC